MLKNFCEIFEHMGVFEELISRFIYGELHPNQRLKSLWDIKDAWEELLNGMLA